jgi:ABC-type multidrug transport system ATPase subunit
VRKKLVLAKRSKTTARPKARVKPKAIRPDTSRASRRGKLALATVKSTSVHGVHRQIVLAINGTKGTHVRAHRFALVGPEDRIHIDPVNSSRMFVSSTEDSTDLIPVTPHFEQRETVRLGAINYEIVIKEITSQTDLEQYEYLEGFHYKTSSSIVTDETGFEKGKPATGGRKAILLAYLKIGKRMMPAGYIELQMPLLMVKPRHVLFAHGFHHPTRPIAWDRWDVPSMRSNVNLIVRIARVVTSPDLRGIGLARILINTSKDFAKQRWHINGRRPLFMEISAEMLKYMDFASSAGLEFIGYTEGNLSRIHNDLVQMLRGQKVSFGIMSLQKKYLTKLQRLAEELGRPFAEVLDRLKEVTNDQSEENLRTKLNLLKPQEWYLFKKVLRFPIPYFMCGLDGPAEEFVADHGKPAPARVKSTNRVMSARIGLEDIRVTSTYEIPDSVQARSIRDCFGLDGTVFKLTLVGPVSLEASGGNIILITGPSGSGKSILLSVLDSKRKNDLIRVSYKDKCGKPYEAAWMNDINSDQPIIQYFSELWGMESSISALNQAGLSEAFVYLRPYRLLSRGQQYRARLAALSLGSAPVWLMDEFCADLDPFTARIVASNIRKEVIRTARVAVIAAANSAHYIDALRPTRIIYLRHNGRTEVLTYKEYVDEFCIEPK